MTEQDLWGPVDINKWNETPYLGHRTATEDDVMKGTATFYLSGTVDHKTIDIDLPSLALLTDNETGDKIEVVVIQAEQADGRRLIGYRPLDGGNGVCELDELTFIKAS
jgi:hypothetical protein